MVFIKLNERYRADCNELVKLFLPENSYAYIDEDGSEPALKQYSADACLEVAKTGSAIISTDYVLRFETRQSGDLGFLWGCLSQNGQVCFQDEIPMHNLKPDLHKNLIMPLKLMIYGLLHRFTGKNLPWGALTGIRPVKLVNAMLQQGEPVDGILLKMQEHYRVSAEKTRLAAEVALNEEKYLSVPPNSVSIYIGIPFCASRCLYCSFPSVSTQHCANLTSDYLKALEKEIRWAAEWLKKNGALLDTVYIGGGTPTALSEHEFEKLLMELVPILPMHSVREYTVEAGRPDTISRQKLQQMKKAAVSRISINPQTMHDKTLRIIGRNHTAAQFSSAFQMAREEGFGNINCDLIAGLPSETLEDFQATLGQIMQLSPESVTVHTMSVKRASRLNEEKESFARTADGTVAAMIDLARASLRTAGFKPYYLYRQKNILANLENVGYAKLGYEGIYNILIMEEIQSILALGAGATSKIVFPGNRIERIFNVKNVEQYVQRIDEMLERKEAMLA
jgi:coproporphyrinogen dehydrogenase HemZ